MLIGIAAFDIADYSPLAVYMDGIFGLIAGGGADKGVVSFLQVVWSASSSALPYLAASMRKASLEGKLSASSM